MSNQNKAGKPVYVDVKASRDPMWKGLQGAIKSAFGVDVRSKDEQEADEAMEKNPTPIANRKK